VIRPGRALAIVVTTVALLGVPLATAPAHAAPAPGCPRTTLDQDIARAHVVFRGEVKNVRAARGDGKHRTRTYRVVSDRVYQSSLVTDVVVVTAEVGRACPPPTLAQGKRYVFFVTEEGSRLVSTSATAKATKKLTAQVVAKLGSGVHPQPAPPPAAEFTLVADASPPSLSRLLAPGAALVIVSLLGLLVVGRLARRTS